MRAVQLATTDGLGGASIAARRLHEGLRLIGVDSRMLVQHRVTRTNFVEQVECADTSLLGRLRRRIDLQRLARERHRFAATQSPRMIHFSDDRVAGRFVLNARLPQADVYNLHGVSEFVDYRRFLRRLPQAMPLVWTLHDMNPFTGGCHYALDCLSFTGTCGRCPQLGSVSENDLSAQIFARKEAAFSWLSPQTTCFVAPSKWLGAEAARSRLLQRFRVDVIPYGVDTNIFCPRPKDAAREVFSIPKNDLVIVFVADRNSLHHKGFDLLRSAAAGLKVARPVSVAVIGHDAGNADLADRFIGLGRIENERLMSFALSAADVFVLPTRTDNLPNVVLEAMACGLPVVSFNVGGLPDMIRQTGFLAQPKDVPALRGAIEVILNDQDLRSRFSSEARRVAVRDYALEVQARRYNSLYENLAEQSRS